MEPSLIEQIFATEAAKAAAKFALDRGQDVLMRKSVRGGGGAASDGISKHLTRVANWALTYNFRHLDATNGIGTVLWPSSSPP